MKFINQLLLHDARELIHLTDTDGPIVDVTITSPPYWDLKKYGDHSNQIGFGQSKEQYFDDIELVLQNCYAVTKSTGSLWLIADDLRKRGDLELIPWQLAETARKVGWKLRELIVWDKGHNLPWHQKGMMRNVTEYIFFMTKTKEYKFNIDRIKTLDEISRWWVDFPERYNPKGKTPTNIWRFPIRRRGTWPLPSKVNHFCPFPTPLVARIIELTTDAGDLVMDPFAGSSVVLAAAEVLDRNYIGFEINPEYVKMFPEVKKVVASEWKEQMQQRELLSKSRSNFEKTIMNLRALKFARESTRPLIEVYTADEMDRIEAIICLADIPKYYQRKVPIEVQVWIIGNEDPEFFVGSIDKIKDRVSRPPLTRYEISPKFYGGSLDDFLKQTGIKASVKRFFVYPNVKPRKFTGKGTLDQWFGQRMLSEHRNGTLPPMLSNIEEDVSWARE